MPCGQVRFHDAVEGFYLKNHVIRNVTIPSSEETCQIRCVTTRYCVSYNLGPQLVNGRLCELSDSDHIKNPQDLIPRERFIYRSTKVIQESVLRTF